MRRRIAIALVVGSLVACGSAGGDLSADARTDLEARVAEVRTAAESGRSDEAMSALVALSERVDAGLASGEIDKVRAERVRAAIAEVMRSVSANTTVAPTTTTAAPTPVKGKGDRKKKGDGHDD
jgi:hypothetical protein